jgi:hypothetical protein
MSATNGRQPLVKMTTLTFIAGLLLGAAVFGIAGVMWHNWQLKSLSDDMTALEKRFVAYNSRVDELRRAFDAEVSRERDEDDRLERGIADGKQALARLEGSLPLKLPAVHEFIEQDKHLSVQDGRLDDMQRKLSAMCGQLAAISAASAKKAGC